MARWASNKVHCHCNFRGRAPAVAVAEVNELDPPAGLVSTPVNTHVTHSSLNPQGGPYRTDTALCPDWGIYRAFVTPSYGNGCLQA
jgi:hypothetical protein